ncbi:hypothetical protein [Sodalinema gerasimenkoae]|uniref:hypothetical protein n=1 Tax=Sodalinema gerasimenkoae TaxID=2862348 RepID=UPI00135CAA34|nr:hypothetical protein [Sodalinema gerasimenkoae]
MATTINQSLLAILVALDQSDEPLTEEQQEALYKMGQRLGTKPKKWSSHLDKLLTVFPEESDFIKSYHEASQALAQFPSEEITQILPDEKEIEQFFPDAPVVKRAYFEGQADQSSQEICNFVSSVVKSHHPAETSKKLNLAQRLAESLKAFGNS